MKMRAGFRIVFVAGASLSVGCTDVVWRFGREIPPHRALDPQYTRLLKLYESGKINAEQLTTRQQELASREKEIARRRDHERAHPTPDPFPQNDTTDSQCKEDRRHPDPRCPLPPGRH